MAGVARAGSRSESSAAALPAFGGDATLVSWGGLWASARFVDLRHDVPVTWDAIAARARSRDIVNNVGFPPPPDWYPTIERGSLRLLHEVEDRALPLNVVINCSFTMPTDVARSWLAANGLEDRLTSGESNYLAEIEAGAAPDSQGHQLQIEALWVLVWAASLVPAVDWATYCADTLAAWLPDLRVGEDPRVFRRSTTRRHDSEVLDELDTAFCLTWGCAEANLRGQGDPGNMRQYVMWERRRGLEWLMGVDWDDPDYNT